MSSSRLDTLASSVAWTVDLIPRGVRRLVPIDLDAVKVAVRWPRSMRLRPAERGVFRLKNGRARGRFYSPAGLRRDRRGRWRRPDGTFASRAEIAARRRLELEARRGPGGRFLPREEAAPLERTREIGVCVRFRGSIPLELIYEAVYGDLAVGAACAQGRPVAFHLSASIAEAEAEEFGVADYFLETGWEVEEVREVDLEAEEGVAKRLHRRKASPSGEEVEPVTVVVYGRWSSL